MVDGFGQKTVLADDHGNAVVDETCLLFGEVGFDRGHFLVAAPHVDRRTPVAVMFGEHEFGGRVVVDRHDQVIVDRVFRQSETFVAGQCGVGVVTGDQEESVGIVAAGGAHDIDEQLIQPVEQFVGGVLMGSVREADLIAAFENQMMIVITESFRNLMP